jgi:nucleotide-binding universal stress UspA family protein
MFRNVLVCVDGSPQSDQALSQAIDLASSERSRLTILTAVPRPPYWACTPMTAASVEPLAREAKDALRAAVDRVPADMPLTKILTREPIREALMEQIKTGTYDLVVMGSRGRGALTSSVLGSVSHFALNHSPVPVLIVNADGDVVAAPERQGAQDPKGAQATANLAPRTTALRDP